jgi:tetratricopeptide (TPR) repeat protein
MQAKPMVFLSNLTGMLAFRPYALRLHAERGTILRGIVSFSAGFLCYVLVRNRVYSELPELLAQPAGPVHYFYHLNLIQTLLFILLVYIPVLILLGNSFSGEGPGISISWLEYRMHVSVLLPLWGLLFLITSPVQWIVPHFLIIGIFEISVGFLVRAILLILYTTWAISRLSCLTVIQASGIFILSWFSLPVFYLLTYTHFVPALFVLAPLLFLSGRWFRKYRAYRKDEILFQRHLSRLSSDPENAASYFQIGKILLKRKNPDKASGYFENALRRDPENPDYGYYLGQASEVKGDWDRALQFYEGVYKVDAEYGSGGIVRELGKACVHLDRISRGMELLSIFLKKHDTDPEARYWMAVALQKTGQTARMVGELKLIMDQVRANPRSFYRQNRQWVYRARDMLRETRCFSVS